MRQQRPIADVQLRCCQTWCTITHGHCTIIALSLYHHCAVTAPSLQQDGARSSNRRMLLLTHEKHEDPLEQQHQVHTLCRSIGALIVVFSASFLAAACIVANDVKVLRATLWVAMVVTKIGFFRTATSMAYGECGHLGMWMAILIAVIPLNIWASISHVKPGYFDKAWWDAADDTHRLEARIAGCAMNCSNFLTCGFVWWACGERPNPPSPHPPSPPPTWMKWASLWLVVGSGVQAALSSDILQFPHHPPVFLIVLVACIAPAIVVCVCDRPPASANTTSSSLDHVDVIGRDLVSAANTSGDDNAPIERDGYYISLRDDGDASGDGDAPPEPDAVIERDGYYMVLLLMTIMAACEMMVQLGIFSTIGMSVYVQSAALHVVAGAFAILATPISKRATNYDLSSANQTSYSPFLTFIYFGVDLFQESSRNTCMAILFIINPLPQLHPR